MEITSKNENNAKHVLVELINMFVDKTDELGIKKNKNNNSSLKARYKMCHVDKKDISCCLIS
jgi:hypothetical protein